MTTTTITTKQIQWQQIQPPQKLYHNCDNITKNNGNEVDHTKDNSPKTISTKTNTPKTERNIYLFCLHIITKKTTYPKMDVYGSIIVVKRSTKLRDLEPELMKDKQTPLNSSSGRGRLGRGTVWLILSFSALSSQKFSRLDHPDTIFIVSGGTAARFPVPGPYTRNRDSCLRVWYTILQNTHGLPTVLPQTLFDSSKFQ